ncbi:hypothetical protein [Mycobacterium phage WXIN]|nr:hypothetical protein [Mycobacterium phage WXIN]
MNPDAQEFFSKNPDEPYWYYTPTLRVPNPKLKPWLSVPRMAWPST